MVALARDARRKFTGVPGFASENATESREKGLFVFFLSRRAGLPSHVQLSGLPYHWFACLVNDMADGL